MAKYFFYAANTAVATIHETVQKRLAARKKTTASYRGKILRTNPYVCLVIKIKSYMDKWTLSLPIVPLCRAPATMECKWKQKYRRGLAFEKKRIINFQNLVRAISTGIKSNDICAFITSYTPKSAFPLRYPPNLPIWFYCKCGKKIHQQRGAHYSQTRPGRLIYVSYIFGPRKSTHEKRKKIAKISRMYVNFLEKKNSSIASHSVHFLSISFQLNQTVFILIPATPASGSAQQSFAAA